MQRASDLLKSKSKEVWFVPPDATVFEALRLMGEKEIGALIVRDSGNKVHGIITERDYARKIALQGKTSRDTLVKDVMTPADKMFTVKPETSVDDCMVLITGKRIRHLPVYDGDRFIGLISIGDVVKSIISAKDTLIDQLSNYIAGKY